MKIFKLPNNIIFTMIILSCAGSKSDNAFSLENKFEKGIQNLKNEKYLQAQSDFKYVLMRGTGSDLGDDAQYHLGESYFRNEEYLLAVAEYEKLTRKMSFSPFVEDARFKICEAYRIESPKYYHDQEYTIKALERYQEFLDDFPNSSLSNQVQVSIESLREKLGKKAYETGILYMKMDEYESAMISFQKVIDEYYDTEFSVLSKKEIITALAKNKEIDEANSLLLINESLLKHHSIYEEAKDEIESMNIKILKDKK